MILDDVALGAGDFRDVVEAVEACLRLDQGENHGRVRAGREQPRAFAGVQGRAGGEDRTATAAGDKTSGRASVTRPRANVRKDKPMEPTEEEPGNKGARALGDGTKYGDLEETEIFFLRIGGQGKKPYYPHEPIIP